MGRNVLTVMEAAWVAFDAVIAYPWVYLRLPQFYADMLAVLAAPTTRLLCSWKDRITGAIRPAVLPSTEPR